MSSFASHNGWDLFTWICGDWNISLIAASTSDMPISLLPDCKSPREDCNASLSEAFLGRSMETWLDIEGCERSSAISTARLQSSNARRASPDTAATCIHRATSFQPHCSPSSCLCLKYNSHYSPFPCSASPDSPWGKKNKIPLYHSEKKDPMIHDQETSDLVWRTFDLLSLLQEVSSDDLPLLLEFSSVPDTLLCSICVRVCVSLLHWIPMSTWQWEEYLAWSKLNSLLVKSSNAM